ncbi:MAG: dihydrofolate reductase family protein [Angustibacter sp.]
MRIPVVRDLDRLTDAELAALYAYPSTADRPVVRANMISTLDGSAVGPNGLSGSINDPADHRVFELLRALADVVLVGATTVRQEGYRPLRTAPAWHGLRAEHGLAAHPTLAVVTRRLDLPQHLLTAGGLSASHDPTCHDAAARDAAVGDRGRDAAGSVLVIAPADADPIRLAELRRQLGADCVLPVPTRDGQLNTAMVVEQLGARGLHRVLTEGGPHLLSAVIAHGLLDELCLSMAPLLVGGTGPRITATTALRQSLRLAHVLTSPGSMLTRWVRTEDHQHSVRAGTWCRV